MSQARPSWMDVSFNAPEPESVARAARVLAGGGLVALPTETLYGIAADATHTRAVARLASLKRLPQEHPILLLLADPAQASQVAAALPEAYHLLAQAFWPGPLTLVVPAAPDLPPAITAGTGTVGLRWSDSPVVQAVAAALGRPVTGTSANVHGRPAPRRAEDLDPEIVQGVDLVLNGGPAPGGVPSTVLDLTVRPPRVVREGAVAWGEIEAVLQQGDG